MESIINNSYKSIGEEPTIEKDTNKKICSKKIIIITISISFVLISLTLLLIYFFVIEPKKPTCNPGYFLPEDDSKNCYLCSLDHCKSCSGTISNNKCTQCLPGYILTNSFCEVEHSIRAIYDTKENGQTISLMHYMYTNNIKKMVIDSNNITEINTEQTFEKSGSHVVLFLFDDELESLADMFYGINELKEINFTYIFDTSKITSFHYMFYSCRNLIRIEMPYLNTSNVEIMSGMFQLCSSLTLIDVSSFDTKNVNSMSTMFSGCASLTSIDLSKFNTENLASMDSMFQGCKNLTYVNLKNFDTKNVYNLNYLFEQCYSLSSIDVNMFNISKVQFMKGMFEDCRLIISLDISHFVNNLDVQMDYMFFGLDNLKYLDISGFRLKKNITMFYGLPRGGKIIVEKNFSELIKGQIPTDWEYVIINESYFL